MGYWPWIITIENGEKWLGRWPNRWDPAADGCSNVPDSGPSFNFLAACAIHDYGYDLLRYLGRSGWHRAQVDDIFRYVMNVHCNARPWHTRYICRNYADWYFMGVWLNSWRQNWGVP
jgi:hypothetical protein